MKNIKRIAAALCAGVAFNCAIATETAPPLQNSELRMAFEVASAAPAPTRSLYIPASEQIAKDMFRDNDVVIFGEIHHSTNFKFLADNPAFFREAAANGVKSINIELPVMWLPLNERYFANGISEDDFTKATLENFKSVRWTSETPPEDYAQQYIAMCKTAKKYGITVRPTDFRLLADASGTSDIYGVPDIADHDDAVRARTLRTLRAYTEKTGKDHPVLQEEFHTFRILYMEGLDNFSSDEKKTYDDALLVRIKEWNAHSNSDEEFAAYQNALQARYISRTHTANERTIFISGSRHFIQQNESIGDYAIKNGYKKIVGVELIAENGQLWYSGLVDPEIENLHHTGHQFKYRIRTDLGQITQLPSLPAPPLSPE